MDRNTVLRLVVIAAAVLLFMQFGLPWIRGTNDKPQASSLAAEAYVNAPGFIPDVVDDPTAKPTDPELCTIKGERFEAELSAHGAGLTHLWVKDEKYADKPQGFDLSTTPSVERWRSLRTLFRNPTADTQLKYDRFDWKLDRGVDGKSCMFTYEDADAKIVKVVSAGKGPFEIEVETAITNLTDAPKRHQFSISTTAYRQNKELKGSLGRQSPHEAVLECASGKDVVRKKKDDFKSGWFDLASIDRYAAVNSHYFSQALVPEPIEGPGYEAPRCELLAEEWFGAGQAKDADDAGIVFHGRLVYPARELGPHTTASYHQTAFLGPKERDILAKAAGGRPKLGDVIDLGFFTPVARVLVGIMVWIRTYITFGNWGLAIIAMTIGLRTLLFPLTYKSIKTTIAMRRLKPEVDSLNEKFKDDAQAKNLAMMELWKKHGVNPFGGCLPQLVQMPVWFAMYTTLQTAVEMYHVKFLWFKDLSAPDQLFGPFGPLPLLLGAFMILQQRIVPQQGMDPMQQKMMMWMLPAVFTFMMLFLPAALGVYMLTNSMLGIAQQLIVERVAPSAKGKNIVVTQKGDKGDKGGKGDSKAPLSLGKGKARV